MSVRGRCDMWTAHVSVLLAVWPLLAGAEDTLYENTNGWIPVSNELVYNQIKREGIQVPQYIAGHNIQLLHTDINKALPEIILKISDKVVSNSKNDFENKNECINPNIANCKAKLSDTVQEPKYEFLLNNFHKYNGTDYKAVRASKKIADFNLYNHAQNLFIPEIPSTKSKANTYEVTEDILEPDESIRNTEGYDYEPPKKKNQTNELFEILSKYKINKDDELPNYDLSRKHKAHITSKLIPPEKPLNVNLFRYNNLNHLPVDPLLAVFLSNYGFYLRGMYGVRNHYNNLYGYLASNNIHNNRPFGVYKIYSDTDSSH